MAVGGRSRGESQSVALDSPIFRTERGRDHAVSEEMLVHGGMEQRSGRRPPASSPDRSPDRSLSTDYGQRRRIYPRDMVTDHWLDMRWQPPAAMQLEIGATPQGQPREHGVIVQQAHILTPETETTTHYFWATTRSADLATEAGDAALRALMAQAFDVEDKPMIEAAYQNLEGVDFWDRKPVYLGVDAGGTRARRMLQRLLARERAETETYSDARQPTAEASG